MAPPKSAIARAEASLAATIAQADRIVSLEDEHGRAAQRDLLSVLKQADLEVAKRLLKITPKPDGSIRFTAAQAIGYQTQIQVVIAKTEAKLGVVAQDVGEAAVDASIKQGTKILATLEKDFRGLSTSPNIIAAMQASQVVHGPKAALATSVATSLDRYGQEMGSQFSRIIQVGLVSGATTEQMIDALVAHGGPKGKVSIAAREVAPGIVERIKEEDIPEGLFVRHRYWAERIIRTEVAKAFSAARLEQLYQMRREGLDVLKKIVAHFDNRTAEDSVKVHGQVRRLEDTFLDGKGRVYQHPPARPNDRETLLPWFADWPETPSTEPPTEAEQQEAVELATTPKPITNAPLVPRSVEEVKKLEREVEHAVVEQTARAAGEHASRPLDPGSVGSSNDPAAESAERETKAAEVLERLRKDRSEKIDAIQRAAEDKRQREQAEADARHDRQTQKLDRKVQKLLETQEPYLAELELHALAGEQPEAFARLANAKRPTPLPPASILGAVTASTPGAQKVRQFLISDTLGAYAGLPNTTLTVEALPAFKLSGLFLEEFLRDLLRKKTVRSQRLIAGLLSSEGVPWAEARKLARDPVQAIIRIRTLLGLRGGGTKS